MFCCTYKYTEKVKSWITLAGFWPDGRDKTEQQEFVALTKLFLKLSTMENKLNRKKIKPRGKDIVMGIGPLLESPKSSTDYQGGNSCKSKPER